MRPPALGYRLRAGISAYGTSNLNTFKLQNQDSKLNARHSESQRDRWQDEYVHSLRIRYSTNSHELRAKTRAFSVNTLQTAVRIKHSDLLDSKQREYEGTLPPSTHARSQLVSRTYARETTGKLPKTSCQQPSPTPTSRVDSVL